MTLECDALVVGGGAAGLSAALVLGRARVSTLLIDAGEQSNRPAPAVGGLLGHDGSPAELYAAGHRQLAELPSVTVCSGTVRHLAPGFDAALDDGTAVRAARVLLATGMRYERPDLPGLEALWGGAAFHCPYCHGWEHRDGRLAVLGAAHAAMRARLLRSWSDDVVVLAEGLDGDERAALEATGVPLDERPVAALEAKGAELRAVRFADGDRLERDGILVAAPLVPRDDLAARLGCELTETPMATGLVVTDEQRRTSVPGVFAAGDAAAMLQQVAGAIAAGSEAAAFLHRSLVPGLPG